MHFNLLILLLSFLVSSCLKVDEESQSEAKSEAQKVPSTQDWAKLIEDSSELERPRLMLGDFPKENSLAENIEESLSLLEADLKSGALTLDELTLILTEPLPEIEASGGDEFALTTNLGRAAGFMKKSLTTVVEKAMRGRTLAKEAVGNFKSRAVTTTENAGARAGGSLGRRVDAAAVTRNLEVLQALAKNRIIRPPRILSTVKGVFERGGKVPFEVVKARFEGSKGFQKVVGATKTKVGKVFQGLSLLSTMKGIWKTLDRWDGGSDGVDELSSFKAIVESDVSFPKTDFGVYAKGSQAFSSKEKTTVEKFKAYVKDSLEDNDESAPRKLLMGILEIGSVTPGPHAHHFAALKVMVESKGSIESAYRTAANGEEITWDRTFEEVQEHIDVIKGALEEAKKLMKEGESQKAMRQMAVMVGNTMDVLEKTPVIGLSVVAGKARVSVDSVFRTKGKASSPRNRGQNLEEPGSLDVEVSDLRVLKVDTRGLEKVEASEESVDAFLDSEEYFRRGVGYALVEEAEKDTFFPILYVTEASNKSETVLHAYPLILKEGSQTEFLRLPLE